MEVHDLHTETDAWVDWTSAVKQVLDAIPGNHVLMLPVWDEAGQLHDFRITAVGATTVDVFGRTHEQMIGATLRGDYGPAVHGTVWDTHKEAYTDGVPRTIGPFPFPRTDPGLPPVQFTLSLRRVGTGLLSSWVRNDDPGRPDERISRTERMARLGMSERDRVTGTTTWSEQLYRIFDHDPAQAPLSEEQVLSLIVPADRAVRSRALTRLAAGQPVDVTFRIRVPSGIKHIRAIAEDVADIRGRPLKTVSILQDITAQVTNGDRLARTEQELTRSQQTLAAESRLAAELQHIILPIPVVPIDMSGLRVAVRYLPAEHANRIGGDWYHAATALDGSVVLAIGDVAGHGIRASATMAKLRHAFATLIATATTDPAGLLRHLNRLLYANGEATDLASAVVARYEPATSTIRWAQAGHPSPLRTRAGSTTSLDRPAGVILGALPEPVYETTSITLHPDELLVFYTDGLIEHRDRSLEEGLAPVVATLNRLSAERSPRPLVDLLNQLDRANPEDDTCVLAVRHAPVT
jgi:serine phosphatase RsbU (regulator of sigma subunit)/PAS domain-containing protein